VQRVAGVAKASPSRHVANGRASARGRTPAAVRGGRVTVASAH
jgi:hypothetical protein